VQPARVSQRRLEKIELLPGRPSRLDGEGDGDDRMFGPEIFQMGLEKAEQNVDRVGRVGNLETMFVAGFIGKSEAESKIARDQIVNAEAKRELFEKTPQDKEERLGCFDFVFEL
jgi:hypothetical protein